MDPRERQRRACSFGGSAGVYERYRPGYPAAAVDWLFGGVSGTVLDLGAGTGKLTGALTAAGHEVVAVEPDPQMREVFAACHPRVPILPGTAERIPLDDRRVGAVAVGQAWHWFDPSRSLPELWRVLEPGGVLGVVWNRRDESMPMAAELGAVLDGPDATNGSHGESVESLGPGFSHPERASFGHVQVLDVEGLLGLVSSRSRTITMPGPERERLLARVERIGRRESDRSADGSIRLPYVSVCDRAVRVD